MAADPACSRDGTMDGGGGVFALWADGWPRLALREGGVDRFEDDAASPPSA